MQAGDILGYELIGIVEEVRKHVTAIKPGDRVVIPFQISRGHCFMSLDVCRHLVEELLGVELPIEHLRTGRPDVSR